jgi:hypothetical protein
VLKWLKQRWGEFQKGTPGRRFQERYERNQDSRAQRSLLARFFQPVIGILVFVAGVTFCFIPGPGLPLVLVGAALLAARSRPMARALDWTELQVRKALRWARRWWREASPLTRNTVLLAAVCGLFGAGYGAYWFIFER